MRIPLAMLGTVTLAMVIVGCGSSTPGASGTPGATLAPGATATLAPITTPGATAPGATTAPTGNVALTGHECDAVPTFSISNPNPPSFAPDTDLQAHFPATIDGQPVTDVQSERWLDFLCAFGGQSNLQTAVNDASTFNWLTMSFGSAKATVDGDEVDLTAFRSPGQDSNAMIQSLAVLAAQSGNDINIAGVSQTNVGGKNVYTWTDTDTEEMSYAYPAGDTLIFFDSVTPDQATKILSALP